MPAFHRFPFWGGIVFSFFLGCPLLGAASVSPSDSVTLSIPLLTPQEMTASQVTVGGLSDNPAILRADLPLLRRIFVASEDLQQARLDFKVAAPGEATISIYRRLRNYPGGNPQPGIDIPDSPTATLQVDAFGTHASSEGQQALAEVVRKWLTGAWPDHGLLLTIKNGTTPLQILPLTGHELLLTIVFARRPEGDLFTYPIKPVAGVYAQIQNGKLTYGGQRLRLWGLNRNDSANLDMVDRLQRVGFNAIRLWGPRGLWDATSAKTGVPLQSHPGDGSQLDRFDHFFATLKEHGFFVWATGLHSDNPMTTQLPALLQDDSFIAKGDDWPQWKQAIQEELTKTKRIDPLFMMLLYFDERTQEVFRLQASAFLNHVNPYTGKRYAEEENIAVWQVQNENGFVYKLLQGAPDSWPAYFRNKLQERWNAWLKDRYHDDAGLEVAWGKLGTGEALEQGTVQLGPVLAHRDDFPKARGDDFVHFAIDLVVRFNKDFEAYCRAQAPTGIGVNVEPFVFDTQYRPSVPWLASDALSGDTISISNYQWALTSSLTAPPSMYVFENHTVQGKAMLVYETNTGNTNPFRGEFPLRVAALASRQDWDGVFFHYYHAPNERNADPTPAEMYLAGSLQYITKADYWSGTHFAFDPVMGSTIAIAGRMFLEGAIPPTKSPAIYKMADDAVYNYQYFNGVDQRADTFARGSRIAFTGKAQGGLKVESISTDKAASPVIDDPDHGRMIIDSPLAHAYIGTTGGRYQFQDGIEVGDFSQPFVSFAMVSADGLPLTGSNATQRIFLTAVDNAGNTGFKMDLSIARAAGGFVPPLSQVAAIHSYGRAPILVDPVKYNLWFPTGLSYQFDGYDFALRKVVDRTGTGTNEFTWDASRELFLGVLHLSDRGALAAVPKPEEEHASSTPVTGPGQNPGNAAPPTPGLADVWNPLPHVKWSDDYATVHQTLREGSFVNSGISGPLQPPGPDCSIVVYEAEVILNAPANIEIDFHQGLMTKIVTTFTQPPALSEAVAAYEKQFGPAATKTLTSIASETSTVTWVVPQKSMNLKIAMTETQGTLEISYAVTPK